jgi:hypothetical protein
MVWQILDWVTIAGLLALLILGIRMATRPEPEDDSESRSNGTLLILSAIAGLAIRLPHLLGWPRSIQLALEIPAVLLIIVGFFMLPGLKRRRHDRQQNR